MFNLDSETFLTNLDEETRATLRRVNSARAEYLESLVKYHKMREQVLDHPTTEAEKSLNVYSKTVVAPLRQAMLPDITALLEQSVNVEGLKSMMPMILMAVLNSVNLPLLMDTLNLDSDMIEEAVTRLKQYISSGD